MQARRPIVAWVSLFVLGVAFVLAAVVGVNVVNNPRSEFPVYVFAPRVLVDVPIKVRAFQGLAKAPHTIVLGSSRVMSMAPSDLSARTGETAFNFGLSSATPQDMQAVYRWMIARGNKPSRLLVGIELEQFQPGRTLLRATRLSPELGPFSGAPLGFKDHALAALHSLTRDYLQDSLSVFNARLTGQVEQTFTLDPDGLRHVASHPSSSPSDAPAKARMLQADQDLRTVDLEQLRALFALVTDASDNGIDVDVFLTPFHPDHLSGLRGSAFEPAQAELIRQVSLRCGPRVRVFDFTNIAAFEGSRDAFDDPHHCSQKNADRMLAAMAAERGDICPGNAASRGTPSN
ncbi:MAG: hypothetical protein NVSMB1_17210 [Polyangiales bacterium]